jgi:hypothetical protein
MTNLTLDLGCCSQVIELVTSDSKIMPSILTLVSSAISRREPRGYGEGEGQLNAAQAALRLKQAVPQPLHQNIVIGLQNDVSCTTNQTSHFPKALRISASNGVLQRTRPGPTPQPPPVNPGQDESNMGNKFLKMMRWKEGTSLGVDGNGRIDPV